VSWRLALLLAAALALRLAIAPVPSYWVDEAFTVRLLDDDFGATLTNLVETESTPPLYYVLAWAWSQVMGLGELGLRSLSALAGAATVGLAWALGRWIAGPRAALAAGALAAVNPFLIWFSTEARAYALATALTTAALLLLVRLLARDTAPDGDDRTAGQRSAVEAERSREATAGTEGRRLATWAALAAGALLTHYATAFVIGAQAVILLRRRGGRTAWAAVAAVTAVGVALIPLATAQRGNDHAQSLDELSGPLGERIAQLPKQFAIGYDAPLEVILAVVALAVLLVGVALALLARPDLRERALVPLTVAAAGLLAPLAATVAGLDVVASRYLLPALVPLLAVAGAGLAAGPWRRAGPALAVALTGGWLAVAVAVAADPRLQTRADWQGVEEALGPAPAGGRAIVTTPSNGALVLSDAYRLPARYGPPRPVVEIALAATTDAGEEPPTPPATSPAFAAAGFTLAEQRRERGYVLQRWRARAPKPLDPALLAQSALDLGEPAAILWQP
jgi:mannosyltransferase